MSSQPTASSRPLPPTHGLRAMVGRDPHDPERAATPLELLYDLVFVISFGVAGSEFAHLVATGYLTEGILAFAFAMFAVVWAWINFTWFASAFDTDDWQYRLLVMVQMVGVVVLALGLPAMFDSFHHHEPINNAAMIVGYVIMRIPMVALWLRAARQSPDNRRAAGIYVKTLVVAQAGWCLLLVPDLGAGMFLLAAAPLFAIEMAGPIIAERSDGGTPWHPHHIAERYGLLAIISFGEILIGTVAALESLLELEGWSVEFAAVAFLGVALTVGLWWVYFNVPAGAILHHKRETSFVYGYGHLLVYTAIAAVGAGLHVIALQLEHHSSISDTLAMGSVALPAAIFMVVMAAMYSYLLEWPRAGAFLVPLKLTACVVSVVVIALGGSLVLGLAILLLAPIASVVAQEARLGHLREALVARITDHGSR